ncbi:HNH endonuclease [Streptomyces sp. ISL-90]|nr:HNH endonuclease [Streptomyces sp. ISL-90]
MKYTPSDPDEAKWHEAKIAERFRIKYGHPDPEDKAVYQAWLKTPVPKDRRRVAVYLHSAFGGECGICRTMIDIDLLRPHPAAAQVDHVSPRAWFGDDVWGNVRVVHAYCNGYRSDLPGQGYGEPDPATVASGLARAVEWFNDPFARAHPKLVRVLFRMETEKQLLYEYREEHDIPHPDGSWGGRGNPEIWKEWAAEETVDRTHDLGQE